MNYSGTKKMGNKEWKDPYVDEHGVLKNKFGITNAEKLAKVEYRFVALKGYYLVKSWKHDIDSIKDLCVIHRYLFRQIYDWAGEIRDYELSKGETTFMPSQLIPTACQNINQQLAAVNQNSARLETSQYAQLLDAINYLHPFREGNGRSTRLFLELLGIQHTQLVNYSRNDPEMIQALNNADWEKLAQLIQVIPAPNRKTAKEQVLRSKLLYLKNKYH